MAASSPAMSPLTRRYRSGGKQDVKTVVQDATESSEGRIRLIFLFLELARLLMSDHLQPPDEERKAVLVGDLERQGIWLVDMAAGN